MAGTEVPAMLAVWVEKLIYFYEKRQKAADFLMMTISVIVVMVSLARAVGTIRITVRIVGVIIEIAIGTVAIAAVMAAPMLMLLAVCVMAAVRAVCCAVNGADCCIGSVRDSSGGACACIAVGLCVSGVMVTGGHGRGNERGSECDGNNACGHFFRAEQFHLNTPRYLSVFDCDAVIMYSVISI